MKGIDVKDGNRLEYIPLRAITRVSIFPETAYTKKECKKKSFFSKNFEWGYVKTGRWIVYINTADGINHQMIFDTENEASAEYRKIKFAEE
jgi:hypothetical protein